MTSLLTLLLLTVPAVLCVPWEPAPRDDGYFYGKHAEFVEHTRNNGDRINAIFMGASITDWFPDDLFATYGQLGAVNYGVAADGIEHAWWRMQNGEIEGIENSVRLLVISDCGSNNAGNGFTAEEIAQGYTAFFAWVRQAMPNAKILVMGLMPRDNGFTDRWIRLADVNIRNSKHDDGTRVRYLDLTNQFAREWGVVDPGLYDGDQLHLSRAGYERWHELITPLFRDMMQILRNTSSSYAGSD